MLKYGVLHKFTQLTFPIWQKLGLHVTRVNYLDPIPDTRTLGEDLWDRCEEPGGIDFREKKQVELLSLFVEKYKMEYDRIPFNKGQTRNPGEYYIDNGSFASVDGEVLYCMVRHFRPKKIIEIGAGNSTLLMAQALGRNAEEYGQGCEFVSIDPYPDEVLERGIPNLTSLITKKAQDIELSMFDKLEEDDILFIDSSHVLKIGSDVQYIYLKILPRLKAGVTVHIHDIFLPADYPKNFVFKERWFWTEQYLLQAFLVFNEHFEVLWAASYMHLKNSPMLEEAFNSYRRDKYWPGSFWIRKTN
jgi:predicted O-methyltransferase YrrM